MDNHDKRRVNRTSSMNEMAHADEAPGMDEPVIVEEEVLLEVRGGTAAEMADGTATGAGVPPTEVVDPNFARGQGMVDDRPRRIAESPEPNFARGQAVKPEVDAYGPGADSTDTAT